MNGLTLSLRLPLVARLLIMLVAISGMYFVFVHMDYSWNWRVSWQYRHLFFVGFFYTLMISVGATILGFVFGMAGGLARLSRNPFIREAAGIYVEFFRGTPLLVQIYIFYFCLAPVVHFDNAIIIGMFTLALFSGAYISEIIRAGVESIDKGQIEAAKAMGLTHRQTMGLVVFPQVMRRITPPVTGQFVSTIKDSSLLSIISVAELTKASEIINATTYKPFEAYLPLALFYLLLTFPLSYLTQKLEKKMRLD